MGPVRTDLESGAIVVSERMEGARSVAFGLYFPTGSRWETRGNNGISHFIEHLVFKGTQRRSGEEINREIDLLGGATNAYTSKETLCLHSRVLPEHLDQVVALLADLASHALPDGLDPEVERERQVIIKYIVLDWTVTRIAREPDMSRAMVTRSIRLGLRRLKRRLEQSP